MSGPPSTVRFMTYNIKSGLHHTRGLDAVAEVIAAAEVDVVALQEVDDATERSGGRDQSAWLRERLGFASSVFGEATPWASAGRYGLAILARVPIVATEVTRLYVPAVGEAPDPETEPRIALGARLDVGGRPVCVTCVHLGLSPDQRRRQTRQVVDAATRFAAGDACIVAGDFNADPEADEMQVVRAAFDDALARVPRGDRASFPSRCLRDADGSPALAIDYVFTTPQVRATARVLHDVRCASDHDPVVAVCELSPA